ncbi:hypothetical protein GCM10023232_05660 [Sphingosinicella ginsenosidimutans]|uniref:DUF2062 domain-containing protein n=1 Tax=Allosphingosinicella ginsenosidimutans TaxID=1176539 RepID=A0A5C6TVB8_9SPHN|nr:DUF2062 domain-containing protein [Sphingosinicella ginsenosidimutans]TXC64414.1 DUF2062 domain-containing protein [Sphingosinicella ginsenosidimutans]
MARWRLPGWIARHIPTRESIEKHRLLRPFAHHLGKPDLWHFNHRSVPRGVAIGLGIGVIIPFMHTFVAAIFAIPARANVVLAAAFTLVVNPLTIPPMYWAAYRIGRWELHYDALVTDPETARQASGEFARLLFWIHEASGPIALGIVTLALSAAAIGYVASALAWRAWLWRRKPADEAGAPAGEI